MRSKSGAASCWVEWGDDGAKERETDGERERGVSGVSGCVVLEGGVTYVGDEGGGGKGWHNVRVRIRV